MIRKSIQTLSFTSLSVISALILAAPQAVHAAAPQCAAIFEVAKTPDELAREALQARMKQTRLMAIPMEGEAGRTMYVEVVPPGRPDLPILLMMPGMNRSGRVTDPSSLHLIAAGYGVAEMSFSVHPFSVGALPKNVTPYFIKRQPKLKDYADETNFVASVLRKEMGVQNIVPVSLSFSGSVTPHLTGYSTIIETVPMTSERAANAEGAAARDKLNAGNAFNPIFGPMMAKSMMDMAYRAKWGPQAKAMVKTFALPESREKDMVAGYTAMSFSAENASWKNANIPKETRRAFILAEREGPALLVDQLRTVQKLMNEGHDITLFIVGNSGHIVPADQPAAYAMAVTLVTLPGIQHMSGVKILHPATADKQLTIDEINPGATNEWFDVVIKELENQLKPKAAQK